MRSIAYTALGILLAGLLAAPLGAQQETPLTTCVVSEDGELVAVDAVRTEEGIFVVNDEGERVAFGEAYRVTGPRYVRAAEWYVRDEPFALIDDDDLTAEQAEVLEDLKQARKELERGDLEHAAEHLREASAGLDPTRLEFVRFGTATAISPSDVERLIFLGTVDGTPVYAQADDLDPVVRTRLERYHETTPDLEVILMADRRLADEVAATGPIYVPVEPGTRCLLQPLNPVRVIRRTQG